VEEDDEARSANEPKESAERRGEEEKWDADHEEADKKLTPCHDLAAHVEFLRSVFVDECESSEEKDNGDEKGRVHDDGVDRKNEGNDPIISREIASIISDSRHRGIEIPWS